jgi:hypothetical protein
MMNDEICDVRNFTLRQILLHSHCLHAKPFKIFDGSKPAIPVGMSPSYDVQERSFAFACDVIGFCRKLPRTDDALRRLSWQLLAASASIGANLEEADAGQTKADFIAKPSIARKEWRRLPVRSSMSRLRFTRS